ncbi:class I SAM-dependent methyltransferase [Polyangium jinanense]|uniref:Class I SAM-dependent methyltransferase n=1 Tax=Polyangium jinanense TaxID=2829994 RepID=A0A9X3X633_9BACT|nr:class I SAM-dependent methyltransferase [Polyangium jinanense]MDC3956157.1 class I SAM-dependent methyltransferase [Polyangium jinanense]MDC3983008.1 class I SAM-dependent methyltransferase [Polyangium jinanense]
MSRAAGSIFRNEARRALLADLAAGRVVSDLAFDRLYPERIRKLSNRYWTPVHVARHAAGLFAKHGARRVLDIGAGMGKFCVVGAITTELEFSGVEQRETLVAAGREVLKAYAIPRVTLIHGMLDDVDFDAYDGFYLFNPFEESTFSPSQWVDRTVPLSEERATEDVARVEAAFARARRGTCIVTFHGFGGAIPKGFVYLPEETRGVPFLRLWVKD